MSKTIFKIVDGLAAFIKHSSIDKKLIGGFYETIQVTAPVISSVVSSFEKVTKNKSQAEVECTRQIEMTKRASVAADIEKERIELSGKELDLKRAALPIIEREIAARRTSESFVRIQHAYSQRRTELHEILSAFRTEKEVDRYK